MTDIQQALQTARERVWQTMGEEYDGATSLAYIHGWRYSGEVGPDDRSVRLTAALDANDALVRAVAKAEQAAATPCIERMNPYAECGEGWKKCETCQLDGAARAEVDRLIAAMQEEGA